MLEHVSLIWETSKAEGCCTDLQNFTNNWSGNFLHIYLNQSNFNWLVQTIGPIMSDFVKRPPRSNLAILLNRPSNDALI